MLKKSVEEYNLDESRVAIQGYSPVSYFESGKAEKGDEACAVEHAGVIYHMTSEEQMAKFKANPDRFVPAYGGWCAFGCAIGKKFPVDPDSFKIVDNRLFLFLKNEEVDALELWNRESEEEQTARADRYWESLTGEKARRLAKAS